MKKEQNRKTVNAKRHAFTLAEVLITLGIIGVVAAVTIPSMMSAYKNFVLKNQFKRVYYILKEAHRRVYNDLDFNEPMCYYAYRGVGATGGWCKTYDENGHCTERYPYTAGVGDIAAQQSDCQKHWSLMREHLKVAKYCPSKALEGGCIPEYNGYDDVVRNDDTSGKYEGEGGDLALKLATAHAAGWRRINIHTINPAMILDDGTIIVSYGSSRGFWNYIVDVNGMKGPNKWGHDLFNLRMQVDKNGVVDIVSPVGELTENGGITPSEMVEKAIKEQKIDNSWE